MVRSPSAGSEPKFRCSRGLERREMCRRCRSSCLKLGARPVSFLLPPDFRRGQRFYLPRIVRDARAPLSFAPENIWNELSATKSKWGRIKGPMGAVVADLLDLGW